jgi:predicted nucleotidyltransferase component of viral defense system
MLHLETVEPRTFSLLKTLQAINELKDFFLVGGTALALKHGHRISEDIDLFGHVAFDKEAIIKQLETSFGKDFEYAGNPAKWAVFCYIQNIKVDIILYNHPLIANPDIIDDIRMYSDKDIAAMKVNAILGRGKKKDFWDIYELLKVFTLTQIIDFYFAKFSRQQLLISIPEALCYFIDAEESEDPVSLKRQRWEEIKKFIQKEVNKFLK